MKTARPENGRLILIRIAGALILIGLLTELVSLVWFNVHAYYLFIDVAAPLIFSGILIYLASLVIRRAGHEGSGTG
jgi:hypothetical protein